MISIGNASAFIQGSTRPDAAQQDTPRSRLMQALERRKILTLPEVPPLLRITPEEAADLVADLRKRGLVEVMVRPDVEGPPFLRAM